MMRRFLGGVFCVVFERVFLCCFLRFKKMKMDIGNPEAVAYWVGRLHRSIVIDQRNCRVELSDWSMALLEVAHKVDALRPLTDAIWRSMVAGNR